MTKMLKKYHSTLCKIISVFVVVCLVSCLFGVVSSADLVAPQGRTVRSRDESNTAINYQPLKKETNKYTLISSIDIKSKTVYVPNSTIKIYKYASKAQAESAGINEEYHFGDIVTNSDGKASVTLEKGYYYVFVEYEVTYAGVKYSSEPLYLNTNEENEPGDIYIKHSIAKNDTVTTTKKNIDEKTPFTGSTGMTASVVALAVAAAAAAFCLKKKERIS